MSNLAARSRLSGAGLVLPRRPRHDHQRQPLPRRRHDDPHGEVAAERLVDRRREAGEEPRSPGSDRRGFARSVDPVDLDQGPCGAIRSMRRSIGRRGRRWPANGLLEQRGGGAVDERSRLPLMLVDVLQTFDRLVPHDTDEPPELRIVVGVLPAVHEAAHDLEVLLLVVSVAVDAVE